MEDEPWTQIEFLTKYTFLQKCPEFQGIFVVYDANGN